MKIKHIAILATGGLAEAIQATLAPLHKDATFSNVTKFSEAPAGAVFANPLGLPNFVPGANGVRVISVPARNMQDATPEARSAQWTMLRGKDSTCEEILPQLGRPESYLILNGQTLGNVQLAVAQARLAIAEAEPGSTEELQAYKDGFNLLKDVLG